MHDVGIVVPSEWLAWAEYDISTDMLVDPTLAQFLRSPDFLFSTVSAVCRFPHPPCAHVARCLSTAEQHRKTAKKIDFPIRASGMKSARRASSTLLRPMSGKIKKVVFFWVF